MRVVALGDCNTGHRSKYEGKKRIYHAWADVVGYELPYITMISRGTSGSKYETMWKNWKADVLDEKPDVVIVFGGINNFTGGKSNPNSDIQKAVTNMVNSAKENNIFVFLVAVQPFKASKFWAEEKQIWLNTFNKWMENFALSQGIVFINAHKFLEEPSKPDTMKYEYDACAHDPEDDGVGFHLSIAGHRELGKFISKYLDAFLKNGRIDL